MGVSLHESKCRHIHLLSLHSSREFPDLFHEASLKKGVLFEEFSIHAGQFLLVIF